MSTLTSIRSVATDFLWCHMDPSVLQATGVFFLQDKDKPERKGQISNNNPT